MGGGPMSFLLCILAGFLCAYGSVCAFKVYAETAEWHYLGHWGLGIAGMCAWFSLV